MFFYRRQKEKRINPACMSPNGSNGSDGTEYTKNLFTASLSSLPTSSAVPQSSAQFHPLALVGGFNAPSLGLTPNETRG